jgi:hypothetical protein
MPDQYHGDAVLVAGESNITVHVLAGKSLDAPGGLVEWAGRMTGPADWFALYSKGEPLTIRLPAGSEGTVLLTDLSLDDPGSDVGFKGSGEPPF